MHYHINGILWRDLTIYDIMNNRYRISEYGDVLDITTNSLVPQGIVHDYKFVDLYTNHSPNRKCRFRIHNLVLNTFSALTPKNKPIANHKDLNRANNHISNLEYTNAKENVRHAMHNHARKLVEGEVQPLYPNASFNKRGNNNPNASVFTEEQVHEICKLMEQGLTYAEILNELGLPEQKNLLDILTKIRSKKLWYSVSQQYNIPNKEFRSPAINYNQDQITYVCKRIADGAKCTAVAKEMGIDLDNNKERDKFQHFFKRIKDKITFTDISDQYF